MIRNKILYLALTVGLLVTLVALSGCAPAGGGTSTIWTFLLFLFIIVAMVYFFMIRPIRQREKRHDLMVTNLEVGDRVITAGGIYGEVVRIDESSVIIKIESGATMRVTKGGVVARPEDI